LSKKKIIISTIIGGVIGLGVLVGFTYIGLNKVDYWIKIIILAVFGTLFGGIIAGILSQDSKKGMIAGSLTGIVFLIGIFPIVYFVNKEKVISYQNLPLEDPYIDMLLDFWQIIPGMRLFDFLQEKFLLALENSLNNQTEFYNSPIIFLFCLAISFSIALFGSILNVPLGYLGYHFGAGVRKSLRKMAINDTSYTNSEEAKQIDKLVKEMEQSEGKV